jgi:hypothetical protein
LIKKDTKNQIKLRPDFFRLNIYENNCDIISLEENDEDEEKSIEKNKDKENLINSIEKEINYVNNLIHITDENLLMYENNNNLNIENKNYINTPEKININNNKDKKSKKKLFSVINYENVNNNRHNKENIIPNMNNNFDEKFKKDNYENENELIFGGIKGPKGDENSLRAVKECFNIFQDKNEINFIHKRKDSNFSNYTIEEKINKFKYD